MTDKMELLKRTKLFVLDMVYILPKSSDLRLSMAEKERNRLC